MTIPADATGDHQTSSLQTWTPRFVTAQDGLKLHLRVHGAQGGATLPVLCLPGLTRTGADFDTVAAALAADPEHPRQVLALDARGRGRSEHDRDPAKYNLQVELSDVLAALTACGLERAIILGTSRGGLLAMLMAAARPGVLAGVIFNDIGPVIDAKGLMRIKGYVGKLPQPRDHAEGAEVMRRLFSGQFPKLGPADWLAAAQRGWELRDGALVPTYDIRLAKTLDGVEPERTMLGLWKEFDALARVPLMVIRGSNSDLLSRETVEAMRVRRPDLVALEIPDQGHTPLLVEPETIRAVRDFVLRCDASHQG